MKSRKRQPPPKRGRIRQHRDKAAAAVVKATALPGGVLASGVILQAAHVPPAPWGWVAAGGVATFYCRDAADAIRERRSGGRRAARQRRKYQGTATASEIRGSLSLSAARKQARVTRPSLAGARGLPAADAGVAIGTGGRPRRTLMAGHEDMILLFGGPRTGKTGPQCWQQ